MSQNKQKKNLRRNAYKMKKIIVVLCLVCCIVSFSPAAFAASETINNEAVESSVDESVRLTYIKSSDNRFSINNNVASVRAYVYGFSGSTTRCAVTVKLQVKTLGLFWTTVETWSASQNGDSASVSGSEAVTAGKSYRTVATVTVWSGSNSESQTLTSGTINT